MIGPGFVLMALVCAATITIYFLIQSKHEETMARIDQGMEEEGESVTSVILNLGIVFCSIGIGFISGYIVSDSTSVPDHVAFPSSLSICGGLGLIVSYLINNRLRGE